jgi:hypothetical protein
MRPLFFLALAAAVAGAILAPSPVQAAASVTDEQVTRAIERAKEWLISQGASGTWPQEEARFPGGRSAMALFTLAYIGENPKGLTISKALEASLDRPCDSTYVRAMRTMALATIQKKLTGPKRTQVRIALTADVKWLIAAQGSHGGWSYESLGGNAARFDFSNTQLAILALWLAHDAGIEVPDSVWRRSQALYYKAQQPDGSWNYGDITHVLEGGTSPGYGTMTAAGLASVYILGDMLDSTGGCPCKNGKSSGDRAELNKRVDLALEWLAKEFVADHVPGKPKKPEWEYYWLYAAERVGIAGGCRFFGTHNWYREGAAYLVGRQDGAGSWNDRNIADTCFAVLFLYKGRAPVLFEKLDMGPKVEWNNHRRDMANLTAYIERDKEQPFQWQIVNLQASMDELHEAPILYLTPETVPVLSADEKKKLREFTDTGGTILVEASCGNPGVRAWFLELAKELWPEWPVRPLGPDHLTFLDPHPLKAQRPEILGIDDGLRICVFYAMDDISCPWQTQALAGREYIFQWGVNLFTYATDHGALRARLAAAPTKSERYAAAVKGGARRAITLARLKTGGDWSVNSNYKALERLTADVARRTEMTLKADDSGIDPAGLSGQNMAYLAGSKEVALTDPQRQALKAYLEKGGFLWVEAAGGADAFDQSFRKLAADLGWTLKDIDKTAALMTGKFARAVGYDLTNEVRFRRSLKIARAGRAWASLVGIYQGDKFVGVYSPLDVVFSSTPYEAGGCRGYEPEDAAAVATNIFLCVSDR